MKIKRYAAVTETEAIQKVKEDLGKNALILNIKSIRPKGIFKFFKKTMVEVTAALDEKPLENTQYIDTGEKKDNVNDDIIKNIELKINNIETLIGKSLNKKQVINYQEDSILNVFYNHLIENDVNKDLVEQLLDGCKSNNINEVVSNLYQKIIKIIGEPKPIKVNSETPNVVFFVGSTGVGKTTTIAKVATQFVINQKKNVGFITSDTYRIAAVEQLKVYARILDIPVKVVYSAEDFHQAVQDFNDKDLIFIDTAGRSHKNQKQLEELQNMLNQIEKKEVFLVLSLASKCKDLIDIINKYKDVTNYNVIFTKADETSSLGNIVNIKNKYDISFSYLTFGQNVPDDIEILEPQKIAKALLGGDNI